MNEHDESSVWDTDPLGKAFAVLTNAQKEFVSEPTTQTLKRLLEQKHALILACATEYQFDADAPN